MNLGIYYDTRENKTSLGISWGIIRREGCCPDFFNLNNIPEGTARIMMRRGISTEEKLTHFLYDTLDNLSDPFLMKGMQQAVRRIIQAIDLKEKIVIYGDYDVDGITSTSICVRYAAKIGGRCKFLYSVARGRRLRFKP